MRYSVRHQHDHDHYLCIPDHVFRTQQQALASGVSKEAADIIAWHTGILACIVSGSIEFFGSFVVHWIRKVTPRVVMLVAIAGTGITFIAMDFVIRTFAYPLLGLVSLALVLVFYFGGVKMRGGIPGGFVIIAAGVTLAWTLHWFGLPSVVSSTGLNFDQLGLHLPVLEVFEVFSSGRLYPLNTCPLLFRSDSYS